jgi:hypothetical protein
VNPPIIVDCHSCGAPTHEGEHESGCFHPTTRTFGGYWPWYFYISKNATPWAACYIREGGYIE